MVSTHESLIRQIHASGGRLALCMTGGGSSAVGQLLEVPGGSRSVLEAVVPYITAAMDAFLGGPPENYCDEKTARLMAMGAFERGTEYLSANVDTPGGSPGAKTDFLGRLAGIGCTASLASDRPKRGAHRVHVAVQTLEFTASVSLTLTKDARSRQGEEQLVAVLVLNAVAEASGLKDRVALELLPNEEPIHLRIDAPGPWQELLWGDGRAVCQSGSAVPPGAMFPGSFNPRHEAHRRMAHLASEILEQPVAYELSVANVDKPLLDYCEIQQRADQFAGDESLWLTRAPTFVEKAAIFPGVTFVVGLDTIQRIADEKYYGNDAAARDGAISRLGELDCRFLVFGRAAGGRFQALEDLKLPPALQAICRGVSAEQFRYDLSSTELRQRGELRQSGQESL